MSRIDTEIQRLFELPAEGDAQRSLVRADGCVRSLVLAQSGPADWALLAPLWRGVQADLGWPAPAIAVNGRDAFEIWFSLAAPLPWADAARLLAQLQRRYLGSLRPDRVRAWPSAKAAAEPPAVPAFAAGPQRWAAFVAPDLPAVFGDDPALDVEPGADAQAELLARHRSISAAELRQARAMLEADEPATVASPVPGDMPTSPLGGVMSVVGRFDDPRAFLLAVMNDEAVPLALRIEAARGALLGPQGSGR
jgi:hypothetical protein